MPNSIVQMNIQHKKIVMNMKLPIGEFELAFGKEFNSNIENFVSKYNNELRLYIDAHVKLVDQNNNVWQKKITYVGYDSINTEVNGTYNEVLASIEFKAPIELIGNEKLTLLYDVIIHQVVTHNAIISITQDWQNGITQNNEKQIGVISLDTKNNVVQPFTFSLQKGSSWKGFANMFSLGIRHIAEGTDHLLFLLMLLLPACLIVVNKKWQAANNKKHSFTRVIKIVTAFTVGHSLTLILGALNIVQLPVKPVEVLIAFSIFITAIHCIKPLFFGKEMYIASGFGLVHGLAFATVLSNLGLSSKQMALSILGFNLGIEAMQLLVVIIVLPVLLMLSKKPFYSYIKNAGAIAAIILSLMWIYERISL